MFVRRTVSPVVCLTSLVFLTAFSSRSPAAGEAVPATASPAVVSATGALKDVAQGLESPAFTVREAASIRLANAQGPAVPIMLNVAKDGNLEAAVRAVGVLEAIYLSGEAKGEPNAVDAAELALEELVRVGRPSVADRADVVLDSHYDIRERRAVAQIRQLNGVATFGPLGEFNNGWNPRFNQIPPAIDRSGASTKEKEELTLVIIGPKWTGGDEGLKQVARLTKLRRLYRIQGCPVSDDAVSRLRAVIPGLEIEVRGAAKLGITFTASFGGEKGCTIDRVQEREAAANAGLRREDRIIRFGNREINESYELVELLRSYRPGQTVEALVARDEVYLKVPVTLTGWD